MLLAGIFGGILFVLLIIGDWYQFTSLRPFAAQYGFGIARRRDRLDTLSRQSLIRRFGKHDTIALPHGVARWFGVQEVISLRPSYQLFSMRFRTAWPLKGTITLHPTETGVALHLTKRVPWSSGLLTLIWLGLVAIGTLVFLVTFGIDGGYNSASGWALALGVGGLGILVLLFGLILMSLAYRLEDSRLMQVYQELQDVWLNHSAQGSG
ncbi:MAG: hypothetical protein F4X63_07535 [Nitrospira sp. SB0662_bin_26]|nr:hypothetical protein [Nitrospira sp. SB0662_bin_26]